MAANVKVSQLQEWGLPGTSTDPIIRAGMKAANSAIAQGVDPGTIEEGIKTLARNPASMKDDPILGPVAEAMLAEHPDGLNWVERPTPAPWTGWGEDQVDAPAIGQMRNACRLPGAIRGAMMPDAHVGYGLPIGGVLAVRDAVVPYAVGVDIACRMRLSILDAPVSGLMDRRDDLRRVLEEQTSFGVGACFKGEARRTHPVMDEDWSVGPVTARMKDKAWSQLGSSGGGNHFVEFGELEVPAPVGIGGVLVPAGTHLALLSHSGSRGSGETVASHYSEMAKALHPEMPRDLIHLAWLDLGSDEGQEYWRSMELMGRYSSANHELIHGRILAALGIAPLTHVENHHNFAWREIVDGAEAIVHRKGATPAAEGILGVVPGSMGDPGFIVRGLGNDASLRSCAHGAGRRMSRGEAFRNIDREEVRRYLSDKGVELLSAGVDEAPMAYKDIETVMASQKDLVDIVATFRPRIVKMAPDEGRQRRR
ncbi:MAG: RtcB family protein [Desulfovibrio sp.]|jgi:tRNA-splicing ligase RtcB|nr:RtcB family protein [Desulfovibrio sp.]